MVIVVLVDQVYLTVDGIILPEKEAAGVAEGSRELCTTRSPHSPYFRHSPYLVFAR